MKTSAELGIGLGGVAIILGIILLVVGIILMLWYGQTQGAAAEAAGSSASRDIIPGKSCLSTGPKSKMSKFLFEKKLSWNPKIRIFRYDPEPGYITGLDGTLIEASTQYLIIKSPDMLKQAGVLAAEVAAAPACVEGASIVQAGGEMVANTATQNYIKLVIQIVGIVLSIIGIIFLIGGIFCIFYSVMILLSVKEILRKIGYDKEDLDTWYQDGKIGSSNYTIPQNNTLLNNTVNTRIGLNST